MKLYMSYKGLLPAFVLSYMVLLIMASSICIANEFNELHLEPNQRFGLLKIDLNNNNNKGTSEADYFKRKINVDEIILANIFGTNDRESPLYTKERNAELTCLCGFPTMFLSTMGGALIGSALAGGNQDFKFTYGLLGAFVGGISGFFIAPIFYDQIPF